MQWFALIGIAPGDASRPALVKGNMQLYSAAQQRSQALEAHGSDVWHVPCPKRKESDCSVRSKDGQSRGRERTGEDAYHRARDATGKHERVSKVSDGIIFPRS